MRFYRRYLPRREIPMPLARTITRLNARGGFREGDG